MNAHYEGFIVIMDLPGITGFADEKSLLETSSVQSSFMRIFQSGREHNNMVRLRRRNYPSGRPTLPLFEMMFLDKTVTNWIYSWWWMGSHHRQCLCGCHPLFCGVTIPVLNQAPCAWCTSFGHNSHDSVVLLSSFGYGSHDLPVFSMAKIDEYTYPSSSKQIDSMQWSIFNYACSIISGSLRRVATWNPPPCPWTSWRPFEAPDGSHWWQPTRGPLAWGNTNMSHGYW